MDCEDSTLTDQTHDLRVSATIMQSAKIPVQLSGIASNG